MYADGTVLIAWNEEGLQTMVNRVNQENEKLG